jgi:sulfate adenylyltransferase subunit 2
MKINLKLLQVLEQESISIIRDSYANSLNPILLYSIGKDSSVLLHLARKAFHPAPLPFPILHVDTKWKFKEMIQFRDTYIKKYKIDIIKFTNQKGTHLDPQKNLNYTDIMKTEALKKVLSQNNFDIIFGGARRDEEASRSKERIVSIREKNHIWNPKNQKPEIWSLFNFCKSNEQSLRVFPLSNWTENDIWEYIYKEKIEVVKLYFSKLRKCVLRNGSYFMIDDNRFKLKKNEKAIYEKIRFRTLGCYPLTAGIKSKASNIEEVIIENRLLKRSERSGRLIDDDKINSMELKKKEGYF